MEFTAMIFTSMRFTGIRSGVDASLGVNDRVFVGKVLALK